MEQVEKTRRRCLAEARRMEETALLLDDEDQQDALLDQTVWMRLLANLPSYRQQRR